MKPDELDLLGDVCPVGTTIIIEGEGSTITKERKRNIFLQIASARAIINRKGITVNAELLERIRITSIDSSAKTLTVRILPRPGYSRL